MSFDYLKRIDELTKDLCSHFVIFGISTEKYIKISSSLEEIEIPFDIIENLIKKNKKLALYSNKSLEWFYNIPDYITDLAIDFQTYNNIALANLPSGLKSLFILNTLKDDCSGFNEVINNLPASLEILYIEGEYFNQPLDLLPISLKCLCIRSKYFNQPLNNLPPSLECLDLKTDYIYKDTIFQHVPKTITSIRVRIDANLVLDDYSYARVYHREASNVLTSLKNIFPNLTRWNFYTDED